MPAPSAGAGAVANGLETKQSMNAKNDGDAGEHRHDPAIEVARAPVEPDGERRVAGEDQQPQQQRALLAAPERRERVAERQRAADVLGDVDEREVAARERDPEDDGGDDRRPERGEQRVLRGEREPAPPLPRGERAGDERVDDEPEAQEERGAAELGHRYVVALRRRVLRGALRRQRVRRRDEVPLRSVPVTTTSRPTGKRSGTRAVVDDRRARRGRPSTSRRTKRMPPAACASPRGRDDLADEQDVARGARQVARLDLRRAGPRDRRVEDEDRERGRDRQRDDEPGGTPPHASRRKDTALG